MRAPWRNPLIRKELLTGMRERKGFLLPTLYLSVLGIFVTLFYVMRAEGADADSWELGRELFLLLSFVQLTLVLLIGPLFSAGAISGEKEQRTFESLLATPLPPRAIVLGKFAASQAFVLLMVTASLPLASVTFLLGGVSPGELVGAYVLVLAAGLGWGAVGLRCSAYFSRTVYAGGMTYALFGLVLVLSVLGMIAFEDLAPSRESWKAFWPLFFNPYVSLLAFFETVERSGSGSPLWVWTGALVVDGVLAAACLAGAARSVRRAGRRGA